MTHTSSICPGFGAGSKSNMLLKNATLPQCQPFSLILFRGVGHLTPKNEKRLNQEVEDSKDKYVM